MTQTMSRHIRLLTALIVAALAVPLLFFAPPASAQGAAAACDVGVLQGNVCVIDHGPITCPTDYTPSGNECVKVTPASTDTSCPAGAQGDPGACFTVVPPVSSQLICQNGGELVNTICVISQPAEPVCPDGFVLDATLDGMCTRFENASQQPPTCPPGAAGVPDGCYIIVPQTLILTCVTGQLFGSICVTVGDPPTASDPACPVSPTVFLVNDFCFTFVPLQPDGTCPSGTIPDIDTPQCQQPVPLIPGPKVCAPGLSFVDNQCVLYANAVSTIACPAGTLEDANGGCRQPVANAPTTYFCADPSAVLKGTMCVFTTDLQLNCPDDFSLFEGVCRKKVQPVTWVVCPNGSLLDPAGTCQQPVADVLGDPYCPSSAAVLTNGTCELFGPGICTDGQPSNGLCIEELPATYLCNGSVVTINMMLGDSGTGTPGIDVILGTNGDDVIHGHDGADVICGRGGNDDIFGGAGNDRIFGGAGDDILYGSYGNDRMFGGAGADEFYGSYGNDRLFGGAGPDVLRGSVGNDRLFGQGGPDILRGNSGNDFMQGGGGSDDCHGGLGIDTSTSCEISVSAP